MYILITGTSSGIGNALALEYLKKDHTVFGISRRLNDNLKPYNNYQHISLDLSVLSKIEESLIKHFSKIKNLDIVLLNAGILPEINDMKGTSVDEIKKVMDVNVWSNKIIIDTLIKQVSSIHQIIAISSGAAVSGSRGWNAYSLSKATLNMLIDLYSKEIKETHFIALAPGVIDTAMQDYIYNLPETKFYPVVKKLRSMKGTEDMPEAFNISSRLVKAIELAMKYESGSFIDIREMEIS